MHYTNKKDFLWGAVVGGTVATLVSLLFTTKKGKQILHHVGEFYEDVEIVLKRLLLTRKKKSKMQLNMSAKKSPLKPNMMIIINSS